MRRHRLELKNALPPPLISTHKEWCRWLASRGSLSPQHRRCLHEDWCVATDGAVHPVGSWEGRRVSR